MKKTAAWAAVLIWMIFIFVMSSANGELSGAQSGFVTERAVRFLSFFGSMVPPGLVEVLVRKAAHMAEYAVLALLLRNAFSLSGAAHPAAMALTVTFFYACGDEFHQKFVDGRNPSPVDVGIDMIGAAVAVSALKAMWKKPGKKK